MIAQASVDSTSTFTTCNTNTSHVHRFRSQLMFVGGLF